ncbi:hypothetical protein [Paenibacillus silvae]|nr:MULTISPECIES: hypothetical protein [Paenibacillus]MCK6078126.1 hypothetical protein [Paenibacillus silvae]MCK6152468.1 hypothetical protein [Paenibacillus silvae]MCK6271009.1 hypothetical protein [Paenibacillus silvae]
MRQTNHAKDFRKVTRQAAFTSKAVVQIAAHFPCHEATHHVPGDAPV